jgi:hypothetical protein
MSGLRQRAQDERPPNTPPEYSREKPADLPASNEEQAQDSGLGATPEEQQRVAERAYFRAENRGFAPGGELEDWLAAEDEVRSDRESKPAT